MDHRERRIERGRRLPGLDRGLGLDVHQQVAEVVRRARVLRVALHRAAKDRRCARDGTGRRSRLRPASRAALGAVGDVRSSPPSRSASSPRSTYSTSAGRRLPGRGRPDAGGEHVLRLAEQAKRLRSRPRSRASPQPARHSTDRSTDRRSPDSRRQSSAARRPTSPSDRADRSHVRRPRPRWTPACRFSAFERHRLDHVRSRVQRVRVDRLARAHEHRVPVLAPRRDLGQARGGRALPPAVPRGLRERLVSRCIVSERGARDAEVVERLRVPRGRVVARHPRDGLLQVRRGVLVQPATQAAGSRARCERARRRGRASAPPRSTARARRRDCRTAPGAAPPGTAPRSIFISDGAPGGTTAGGIGASCTSRG